MTSEMKKRKVDWKQIDEMMKNTFPLRRKEKVEDEPPVAEVKDRWPALFSERQVSCHTYFLKSDFIARDLTLFLFCYLPTSTDCSRICSPDIC